MARHSTPPLIFHRPATDTTDAMVRFVNRRRRERRSLTVRRVGSRDGYRLLVTYPGGLRRLHTFPDESALVAGTWAGAKLFHLASERTFRLAALTILLLVGVSTFFA